MTHVPVSLPGRDRDPADRALDVFLAACELAVEQLQLALAAIDRAPAADGDEFSRECLRKDAGHALLIVRFFQQLAAEEYAVSIPAALTTALRRLAPCRPAEQLTADLGEWHAKVALLWLALAGMALLSIDDDAATVAGIVLADKTDLIDSSVNGGTPMAPETERAVLDYLDGDPEGPTDSDPAELPASIVAAALPVH